MVLTQVEKRKIEEEEKYRHAVVKSISGKNGKTSQKHGVPLLLSIFIPGLGQLVKGQVKKGLLIFFAPPLGLLIILLISLIDKGTMAMANSSYLFFGTVILYIWQLIDAYND